MNGNLDVLEFLRFPITARDALEGLVSAVEVCRAESCDGCVICHVGEDEECAVDCELAIARRVLAALAQADDEADLEDELDGLVIEDGGPR